MLLLQQGCSFATHNHPRYVGDFSSKLRCPEDQQSCAPHVEQAAQRWQCVSDDPWATHWRTLATKFPDARLVLTLFPSPLFYGVSRVGATTNLARQANASRIVEHAHKYASHVNAVGAAFKDDPADRPGGV